VTTLRTDLPLPILALAPHQAAAALSLGRTFFDEQVAPELRWVRRGRRKFVSVRELERWLEENSEPLFGSSPL
jgi:hypothetical protein